MSGMDEEDRKRAIDEHKHDQINKQKEGKGHWKRELASNSEGAVREINPAHTHRRTRTLD